MTLTLRKSKTRARVFVNWTAVLAVLGLFAAPVAHAAIVFEEVVTGTGSSTSTLLPSIQGGSSQTYIVFIETENNSDVTAVSGGGLTWAEQKEQCGAANVAGSRVWTAQGSPGGAFQAQITKSGTLELSAVLVRYSGVSGFEGAAGENKNGLNDTSCGGGETSTAQLTLSSTQANTVHLVGVGMKAKTVVSVSAGYTLLGSEIQNTSKAYLYARTFASATTDQLQASLNGGDSWATAGLVLVPAGNTAPSISKAFAPDSILTGGASTLTFTLSNPNAVALTGANFTDTYPATMVNTTPLVVGGTCANVTHTAVAGGGTFNLTAGNIPAAASCTITVNVTATATGANTSSVLNTNEAPASASGGSATLNVALPSLSIVKSTLTLEDPVSGTTDPKAIPGAIERYLIEVTNTGSGPADADTVFITDSLPAIMALRVIDFDAVNPGPVAYVDGSPSSGLSYTFTSLGSGTDDIEFSSDGGSSWTYTPVGSGDGTDPAVTDIRINPKGIFAGNTGGGDPSFQLRFKAVIQ